MNKLFLNGERQFYAKYEKIDIGNNVYFVQSGSVGLFSREGKQRSFIFLYRKGEIFPYIKTSNELISGRELLYRALTPVTLLSIPRKQFEAEVYKPENIKAYVGNLLEVMELQIQRIDNLEQTRVYQKLIERLQFIAMRVGISDGEKVVIETPISHTDIATSIGSTRETVNRFMKKLERKGVITIKNEAVIINSLAQLKELSRNEDGRLTKFGKRIQLGGVFLAILTAEALISSLQDTGIS